MVLGSICATGISDTLPHYSLFLVYYVANYQIIDPVLVTFGQMIFLLSKSIKSVTPF